MAETLPNIVFVGNPGAGKSTLLNTFLGYSLFRSGLSTGPHGLTRECMSVCMYDNLNGQPMAMITDTPGLSEFDGASIADNLDLIRKALLTTSKLKLVFVITFDNGYLRDMDVAAVATVLDGLRRTGIDVTNHYGVIVNRISPRWATSPSAFSSSTSSESDNGNLSGKFNSENESEQVNENENVKQIHRYIKEKLFEKLDRRRQNKDTETTANKNKKNSDNNSKPCNTSSSQNDSNPLSSTALPRTDKFLFVNTEYDAIDRPDAVLQQNGVRDQLREFVNKWEAIALWHEETVGGRRNQTAAMVAAAAQLRLEKSAHDNEIERLFGSDELTKTKSSRGDAHTGKVETAQSGTLERKTSANIPLSQLDKKSMQHHQSHHAHQQENNSSGVTNAATIAPSTATVKSGNPSHHHGQQALQKLVQRLPFGRRRRMNSDMLDSTKTPSLSQAHHRQGSNYSNPRNNPPSQRLSAKQNKTRNQSQLRGQDVKPVLVRKGSNENQPMSSSSTARPLVMLSSRPPLNPGKTNNIKPKAHVKELPQFQDMPDYIMENIRQELPEDIAKNLKNNMTFDHLQKLLDEESREGCGERSSADVATDSSSDSVIEETHSNGNSQDNNKINCTSFEPNKLLKLELEKLELLLKTDRSSSTEISKLNGASKSSNGDVGTNPSPMSAELCRVIAGKQFKKDEKVGYYYGEIHFKSPWPEQDLVVTMSNGERIDFSQNVDSMGGLRYPHAVKANENDISSKVSAWIVPMSFCVLRYMRRVHNRDGQLHDSVNVGVRFPKLSTERKYLSLSELTNHQLIEFFATKDINVGDELFFWAD